MRYQRKLQRGILIKRYKRFLADIETEAGNLMTIHCPNTGSMKNCQQPGSRVWYTESQNPKRKYAYTWELVEVEQKYTVGINTGLANKLVYEAIEAGRIEQLACYQAIRTEVPYGEQGSRIDLLLENPEPESAPGCYVEVKNVSLGVGNGLGIFPDSISSRGQKHLAELLHMLSLGHRAVLLFCVQHSGIDRVTAADEIDAEYGRLLREVTTAGVEVFAYRADFDIKNSSIELHKQLPVIL